jgi:hypothetical protein
MGYLCRLRLSTSDFHPSNEFRNVAATSGSSNVSWYPARRELSSPFLTLMQLCANLRSSRKGRRLMGFGSCRSPLQASASDPNRRACEPASNESCQCMLSSHGLACFTVEAIQTCEASSLTFVLERFPARLLSLLTACAVFSTPCLPVCSRTGNLGWRRRARQNNWCGRNCVLRCSCIHPCHKPRIFQAPAQRPHRMLRGQCPCARQSQCVATVATACRQ